MNDSYTISRRRPDGTIIRGLFPDVLDRWRSAQEERWLFLSPHDDDLAVGGALTLRTAVLAGIRVRARIVTDGRMGYTSITGPEEIVATRREETARSFEQLGVTDFDWYRYPDAQLPQYLGRRRARADDPHVEAGYSGLQNSFTAELRSFRPTRVFVLSAADFHPDHKQVHQELLISLFHAQGDIWPELGSPLSDDPRVYELATYCPFTEAPDLELRADPELFSTKLASIGAFVSQAQIKRLVEGVRRAGAVEYIRTFPVTFYDPAVYAPLFDPGNASA